MLQHASVGASDLVHVPVDSAKSCDFERGGDAGTRLYGKAKRLIDCSFSIGMLVLTAPLLLCAAVMVKLTSKGPILYSQVRLGRGGKPFWIYKFRSMRHECEKTSGAVWSAHGDPRVTPIGRFLRRTHIDELPRSFWNVIRGDMALVGPRPERPEFVPKLEEAITGYRERMRVRPGLSGLAQVQLPPDTDLESVRRKLAHDLYYIDCKSFWLDFRSLICTGLHVVGLPYGLLARLMALPSGQTIDLAYKKSIAKTAPRPTSWRCWRSTPPRLASSSGFRPFRNFSRHELGITQRSDAAPTDFFSTFRACFTWHTACRFLPTREIESVLFRCFAICLDERTCIWHAWRMNLLKMIPSKP